MSFSLDYNKAKESSELVDGKYHVRLEKAEQKETPNGSQYLNVWLRVRDDVGQPCKTMVYFHKIFRNKETNAYPMAPFHTIGKVLKLQDGKKYKSLSEFFEDCKGKVCTITLKTSTNKGGYTNQNIVKWEEYKSEATTAETVVNDDDYPF